MMGEKLEMRPSGGATVVREGVAPPALDTSTKFGSIGSIDDVRSEIDDAHEDMREFYLNEPDEVMRKVSGHLARMTELSKEIRRIEGSARMWKSVRTAEIDPTIDALFQQFQIHSRLQSVREMDFRVSGMNG
jgi:hypothetical protein